MRTFVFAEFSIILIACEIDRSWRSHKQQTTHVAWCARGHTWPIRSYMQAFSPVTPFFKAVVLQYLYLSPAPPPPQSAYGYRVFLTGELSQYHCQFTLLRTDAGGSIQNPLPLNVGGCYDTTEISPVDGNKEAEANLIKRIQ